MAHDHAIANKNFIKSQNQQVARILHHPKLYSIHFKLCHPLVAMHALVASTDQFNPPHHSKRQHFHLRSAEIVNKHWNSNKIDKKKDRNINFIDKILFHRLFKFFLLYSNVKSKTRNQNKFHRRSLSQLFPGRVFNRASVASYLSGPLEMQIELSIPFPNQSVCSTHQSVPSDVARRVSAKRTRNVIVDDTNDGLNCTLTCFWPFDRIPFHPSRHLNYIFVKQNWEKLSEMYTHSMNSWSTSSLPASHRFRIQ